jgi:hypothetical protein
VDLAVEVDVDAVPRHRPPESGAPAALDVAAGGGPLADRHQDRVVALHDHPGHPVGARLPERLTQPPQLVAHDLEVHVSVAAVELVEAHQQHVGRQVHGVRRARPHRADGSVGEPRLPGRRVREVAAEHLLEEADLAALEACRRRAVVPVVVADVVVAERRVEGEVADVEPVLVRRVVEVRGPTDRLLLLAGGADRPEDPGVVVVATPVALDQVTRHQDRVGVDGLDLVQEAGDALLELRGPRVRVARAPGRQGPHVADVLVQEVGGGDELVVGRLVGDGRQRPCVEHPR